MSITSFAAKTAIVVVGLIAVTYFNKKINDSNENNATEDTQTKIEWDARLAALLEAIDAFDNSSVKSSVEKPDDVKYNRTQKCIELRLKANAACINKNMYDYRYVQESLNFAQRCEL